MSREALIKSTCADLRQKFLLTRDGILKQAEAAAREKLDGYRKEAEQYNKRLQQGQEFSL